jgi:hypothetical protein
LASERRQVPPLMPACRSLTSSLWREIPSRFAANRLLPLHSASTFGSKRRSSSAWAAAYRSLPPAGKHPSMEAGRSAGAPGVAFDWHTSSGNSSGPSANSFGVLSATTVNFQQGCALNMASSNYLDMAATTINFAQNAHVQANNLLMPYNSGTINAINFGAGAVVHALQNLSASAQTITFGAGAEAVAEYLTLSSANSLTFQSTAVPYLGSVTVNAGPPAGQPFAGLSDLTGPDWGSYGYAPNDFITLSNGANTLSGTYIVAGIVGDNGIAASSTTSLHFGLLNATTAGGNINIQDLPPQSGALVLETANAGAGTVQMVVNGPVYSSDYLVKGLGDTDYQQYESSVNLTGSAVDLTTTGSGSQIGLGPPRPSRSSARSHRGLRSPATYANASASTTFTIAPATPQVSVKPVKLTAGKPLANSQLSGKASFTINGKKVAVPGTFSYTSAAGTVLAASTTPYTEAVTFTPTSTNYATLTNLSVLVTVGKSATTTARRPRAAARRPAP